VARAADRNSPTGLARNARLPSQAAGTSPGVKMNRHNRIIPEDRRDPGRAPLPPEHPELGEDRDAETAKGNHATETNSPPEARGSSRGTAPREGPTKQP